MNINWWICKHTSFYVLHFLCIMWMFMYYLSVLLSEKCINLYTEHNKNLFLNKCHCFNYLNNVGEFYVILYFPDRWVKQWHPRPQGYVLSTAKNYLSRLRCEIVIIGRLLYKVKFAVNIRMIYILEDALIIMHFWNHWKHE